MTICGFEVDLEIHLRDAWRGDRFPCRHVLPPVGTGAFPGRLALKACVDPVVDIAAQEDGQQHKGSQPQGSAQEASGLKTMQNGCGIALGARKGAQGHCNEQHADSEHQQPVEEQSFSVERKDAHQEN